MFRFNVPLIPDQPYIDDLNRLGERIYAVHFSLHQPILADARVRLHTRGLQPMVRALRGVPAARKYLLANSRFQLDKLYRSGSSLTRLIEFLEQLLAGDVLHGIVFSDGYLLKALSDAAPQMAACLEAIPSINFMIDSASKLSAVLALVGSSNFLMPGKITLDRSLNRRPGALADLAALIRKRHAGMRIELLANEGCLNHCPFRATHEALIAAANTGAPMDTFRQNRDLGCVRIMSEAPHRILASPFIRPEDLQHYTDVADIIKICGRTLGSTFLRRAVAAYAAGKFTGNLFDLLDASHWMGERWELANHRLPEDLYERLVSCDQNCTVCDACAKQFQQHARALPVALKTFDQNKIS